METEDFTLALWIKMKAVYGLKTLLWFRNLCDGKN